MRAVFRFASLAALKASSSLITARNAADSADADFASRKHFLNGTTSGSVALKAGATVTTYELALPLAQGAAGTTLQNDGTGALTWQTIATGTSQLKAEEEVIAFNSSTPVTIFTFPANARILKVTVDVETVFNATGPSLSVGVSGTTSKYFGATDVDLATLGLYVVDCTEEETTALAVIVTFAQGTSGTTGSARVTVHYVNPG
jgi:hypothetical protein